MGSISTVIRFSKTAPAASKWHPRKGAGGGAPRMRTRHFKWFARRQTKPRESDLLAVQGIFNQSQKKAYTFPTETLNCSRHFKFEVSSETHINVQ